MTENSEKVCKIDAKGFQDLCKHFAEIEKENKKIIFENNKLKEELREIKSMNMFEFADKYCNDKQLADAGHAFARALGVGGA